MLIPQYIPQQLEANLQKQWQQNNCYASAEDATKEKFYCLAMFPYPSGKLHMGHVRNYTITDVISRFQRMLGKNVLNPMGWDAFGMPAENAAIQNNKPPAEWTYQNVENMRSCLQQFGFSINWDRELYTCKPDYYRHEQWLFTQLFAKGIAYKKDAPVNWCENDNTVLANEQVIDGKCWRCNSEVEVKNMAQWFVRISEYADRLLDDLNELDWPKEVLQMQQKWIGKSQGINIAFDLETTIANQKQLKVFTTRADTLYGCTFLALAIDHPITKAIAKHNTEVASFVKQESNSDNKEASLAKKAKRGIDLGIKAIHPLTKELLPLWTANFVLTSYGEGAVMSVPAHDQRDYEFASKYKLPILQVIAGGDIATAAYTEKGKTINSGAYNGLDFEQAYRAIAKKLAADGSGEPMLQYRLRDWNVSRQRYWGAPIPIVQLANGEYVAETNLPVILPENLLPDGKQSPLAKDMAWQQTTINGSPATREVDTFDTFMESAWYFARFTSPQADTIVDKQAAHYWLPVDQYVGGIEHAVLHLLYARFYYKLLADLGFVPAKEPFKKLLCQGMVLANSYYSDYNGEVIWHNPEAVAVIDGRPQLKASGQPVKTGGMTKMSKSKNNGIDPMPLIAKYGADAIRLFMMFAAPPEQTIEWSDSALQGSHKFLNKLWLLYHQYRQLPPNSNTDIEQVELTTKLHQTLQKVFDDFERRQTFNTAIAAIMELINLMRKQLNNDMQRSDAMDECLKAVLLMLQPLVPHITSELWQIMSFEGDIQFYDFPQSDSSKIVAQNITYILQVNGKTRSKFESKPDLTEQEIIALAHKDSKILAQLDGKQILKTIYVPNKLLNIVVR